MSQNPWTLATEINELFEEGFIKGRISMPEELEQALELAAQDDTLIEETLQEFKNMSDMKKHETFENLGQMR